MLSTLVLSTYLHVDVENKDCRKKTGAHCRKKNFSYRDQATTKGWGMVYRCSFFFFFFFRGIIIFIYSQRPIIEYLSDLLIKSEQIKNLRSNDKEILKVPFSKTAYYDRSFSVNGAKLWNSLPLYLRQSTNINTFKKSLKLYLQNSET